LTSFIRNWASGNKNMRSSLALGLAGGIIAFLVGGFEYVFGAFSVAFGIAHGLVLLYLTGVSFVGGNMGIVGGAIGNRKGGIIMIIGGALALIGSGIFGILGLVLLVVGGGLAFREAASSRQRKEII
jgi:hypothetical protein